MLTVPTLDKLKELKMQGMARAFEEQLAAPSEYNPLSFEERLSLMVDREAVERENRRLQARLKKAKFREKEACMEDIDFSHARGLDRLFIKSLSTCRWVKEKYNILITGPTGVGKSYISCSIAHKACLEGYSAVYERASKFFSELILAKGDGRYSKLLNRIAKTNVLIIDDWGLTKLNEQNRNDFLEIIEERHQLQATIITSQLPLENWHEAFGNATIADAIMDRLINNSYKINLKGESMRKIKNTKKEQEIR